MRYSPLPTISPTPEPARGRTRARFVALLVALLGLVVLAACGENSESDSGSDSDSDSAGAVVDDGDQTTASSADDQAQDDPATSLDDSDDQAQPDVVQIPGACPADEANNQPFYAVTNIAEDDPDGGLNVRDNYENGEKLATLESGTVVYAEDCFALESGAVWFAIQTNDDVNGWVNAAFLSPDISPLEPTFGGEETEEKVMAVLDALAARRWERAAELLAEPDSDFLPVANLLGDPSPAPVPNDDGEEQPGPDLAALLQSYCGVRICDAPYEVVDVRGSYVPARVSPEVDVRFIYSGGIVTETFGRTFGDDEDFTLDTLPGQSTLAFNRTQPTVGQLVTDTGDVPAGLLDAAEVVRRGLLAESGPGIGEDQLPDEGVVLAANAFIPEAREDRQIVTGQDLTAGSDELRLWGYSDGVGAPILETVGDWMAQYRRNIALLEPDEIGVDRRVGQSNTIDNLAASFPEAHIVEFHRAGRDQLSDFNWSSVRLAMELRDREWKVVAITLDSWTV